MPVTGFTNAFTQGEICDDAWDRTDIQPVNKGCRLAQNYTITVQGPLAKRRGFWDLGPVPESGTARLVPFFKGMDDAQMLVLQDGTAYVYQSNGSPQTSGSSNVQFALPWTQAFLAGLRWKQVADVLYFRHSGGFHPYVVQRASPTSWSCVAESFNNGPWLPENQDPGTYLIFTGTSELDANPSTGTGSILAGQTVTISASQPVFDPAMVSSLMRIRAPAQGSGSAYNWTPGQNTTTGWYVVSNGHVYVCSHTGGHPNYSTLPPVHLSGSASDGDCTFDYRHDGSGVVQITGVSSPTSATATVIATIPVISGQWTSYFALTAYSDYQGWPRAWPTVREERIVNGATAKYLDFIDLSETAGFSPVGETYHPGTGLGLVLATDAVRRRLGDGGAGEILWTLAGSFLMAGTTSGEHLIAGPVLDEPISPQGVVVKQVSAFGSEDVQPQLVDKSVMYVPIGAETLRELTVDPQQQTTTEDLTVLASHIGRRKFVQLAWVKQPDWQLWARLGDGGLASFAYHSEQQVKGWTTHALPGGWVCEDIQVLPGPGRLMTLWAIMSRVKFGATQRHIWMLSQPSDRLFMDCAQAYAGAPVSSVSGLTTLANETVLALADGAQVSGRMVGAGGRLNLPGPASNVLVGLPYSTSFESMGLDLGALQAAMGMRQRPTGAIVSLLTAEAFVSTNGKAAERVGYRLRGDITGVPARRLKAQVTLASDTTREPTITITETTAFDMRIYSIRPQEAVGG